MAAQPHRGASHAECLTHRCPCRLHLQELGGGNGALEALVTLLAETMSNYVEQGSRFKQQDAAEFMARLCGKVDEDRAAAEAREARAAGRQPQASTSMSKRVVVAWGGVAVAAGAPCRLCVLCWGCGRHQLTCPSPAASHPSLVCAERDGHAAVHDLRGPLHHVLRRLRACAAQGRGASQGAAAAHPVLFRQRKERVGGQVCKDGHRLGRPKLGKAAVWVSGCVGGLTALGGRTWHWRPCIALLR